MWADKRIRACVAVIVLLAVLPCCCLAGIRELHMINNSRPMLIIQFFQLDSTGTIELNISGLSVKMRKETPEDQLQIPLDRLGFLLIPIVDFEDGSVSMLREAEENQTSHCVLDKYRTLFNLKDVQAQAPNYFKSFSSPGLNDCILLFASCVRGSLVTMDVKASMFNMEKGKRNYLSARLITTLKLRFTLSLIYTVLGGIWAYVCTKQREAVHRIHILMGVLLLIKILKLLTMAEALSHIQKSGDQHGWDRAFYVFSVLQGVMLFTVITLIGMGWSFLKPYLEKKEKKVLLTVISLQVFANVARTSLDAWGPHTYDRFVRDQVFLLFDMICFCAVLFSLVSSIKHLRVAAHSDGKAARNAIKLKLFRQYYVVVIGYICFTRIILFALIKGKVKVNYRHTWTIDFALEAANLAFYIFTGYKFRPVVHNPSLVLEEGEDKDRLLEPLKDEELSVI